eukprot:3801192-Prymnesium_polylepis.1
MARGTSGVVLSGRKDEAKRRLAALKEAEARAADKVKEQVEGFLRLFDTDNSGELERPEAFRTQCPPVTLRAIDAA